VRGNNIRGKGEALVMRGFMGVIRKINGRVWLAVHVRRGRGGRARSLNPFIFSYKLIPLKRSREDLRVVDSELKSKVQGRRSNIQKTILDLGIRVTVEEGKAEQSKCIFFGWKENGTDHRFLTWSGGKDRKQL